MNYVKAIVFTLILLVASTYLCAEMPDWLWAHGVGAAHTDVGQAITVDSEGYIYSTGRFCDTVSFGSISLSSAGSEDIYVSKQDSNGNWLWVQCAGGVSGDLARDIAVDSAGNVYITGYFWETADFGSTTLTSGGRTDIFVAKLDSSGNWLWAKQANAPYDDDSFSIALDDMDNVYITGYFANTITFGAISLVSNGGNDIFVAKLDSSGNWLRVQHVGGSYRERGMDLEVDSQGNIYVAGHFNDSIDFGLHSVTAVNSDDIFVACMESSGNWIWAQSAGGSSSDISNGIAIDSSGNILLVGAFGGTASFGSIELSSEGQSDTFVAKMDNAGNWLWAVRGGGELDNTAIDIATDAYGNCYVAGQFSGAVSFGGSSFSSSGQGDIFVAKLDPNGNWLWADRIGGELNDCACGIAVDSSADIYVCGWYTGDLAFGPNNLSGSGHWDIFIAKLGSGVQNNDALLSPPLARAALSVYPNPFNYSTSLSLALDNAKPLQLSAASLIVYDLKGRKIRTLCSPEPSNTGFQVTWDGRDDSGRPCPSGVYLAKLYANGQSLCVKRMSLVN